VRLGSFYQDRGRGPCGDGRLFSSKDRGPTRQRLWRARLLPSHEPGAVPHSGLGLSLERTLLFLTGMGNIRDAIPFARTPGNAEF